MPLVTPGTPGKGVRVAEPPVAWWHLGLGVPRCAHTQLCLCPQVMQVLNADAIVVKLNSGDHKTIHLSSIRPPRLEGDILQVTHCGDGPRGGDSAWGQGGDGKGLDQLCVQTPPYGALPGMTKPPFPSRGVQEAWAGLGCALVAAGTWTRLSFPALSRGCSWLLGCGMSLRDVLSLCPHPWGRPRGLQSCWRRFPVDESSCFPPPGPWGWLGSGSAPHIPEEQLLCPLAAGDTS